MSEHRERTYYVMYHRQPLGSSHLEGCDASMGVAFGTFKPMVAYASVREVFLLFTQAMDDQGRPRDQVLLTRYYQARDDLQLTLETAQGQVIPASVIHIVDWGDLGCELEVHISDATFFHDHPPQ
jgi:hypothetical protein